MSRFIDLSHAIESGRDAYPGLPAPRIEPHRSHAASRPDYGGRAEFEITRLFLVGNTGTYLDSPYHRLPAGIDIAALSLEALAGLPGRVLDASPTGTSRAMGPDLAGDLAGHAVLLRTGWDRRRGTAGYWDPAPYVPAELAGALVVGGVALVGVDTWNIDDVDDPARPAHTILLEAGVPIVEHLRGLDRLPALGFRFTAVPAPIRGAASMPVRAFAELDVGWRDS
jgi:arylformamidase